MQSTTIQNLLLNKPKQRQWLLFTFVLIICSICALFADTARDLLRYESNLLVQQEYWRLLTAHFVHLGWSHFLLNMAAFFALWMIYGGVFSLWSWLFILLITSLGISICFLQFDENLIWYVGLSGVLHAIISVVLVYLLLQMIIFKKPCFLWEDKILLVLLIFKLLYEQLVGAIPLTESSSGGPVIVNAHFYGAIIGCICAIFLFKFTHLDSSK